MTHSHPTTQQTDTFFIATPSPCHLVLSTCIESFSASSKHSYFCLLPRPFPHHTISITREGIPSQFFSNLTHLKVANRNLKKKLLESKDVQSLLNMNRNFEHFYALFILSCHIIWSSWLPAKTTQKISVSVNIVNSSAHIRTWDSIWGMLDTEFLCEIQLLVSLRLQFSDPFYQLYMKAKILMLCLIHQSYFADHMRKN